MKILNRLIADVVYNNQNTNLDAATLQEAIDALYELIEPLLNRDIDGGTPGTTEFMSVIDGGSPSSEPTRFIDGGGPSEGLQMLDGGSPSIEPTQTTDGGNPLQESQISIDGGFPSSY
jgi:hypothetical protein